MNDRLRSLRRKLTRLEQLPKAQRREFDDDNIIKLRAEIAKLRAEIGEMVA